MAQWVMDLLKIQILRAVGLMVSATDKSADADLLWEKNIVPDKFKRTGR
jgi:hypothetical protein